MLVLNFNCDCKNHNCFFIGNYIVVSLLISFEQESTAHTKDKMASILAIFIHH